MASSDPVKVTVWCALWLEGVITSYFFENDKGTTVTVNSERYGHMIIDFFACYDFLENTTLRICGFNKTVPHATQLERIWLYYKRPGRVISRRGDIN